MDDPPTRLLVTDFDGTMTGRDFYELVVEQLLPPDTPDRWNDYRAGRITHFEALRDYFSYIRCDEQTLLALTRQMKLVDDLATMINRLKAAGWKVVIASAGCRWYIERLLAQAGAEIELHANPGEFDPSTGLRMQLPTDSPFYSPTHGIDKAGIVRHYLKTATEVAFAGDGYPDIEGAKLVPAELRFARGALASVLEEQHLPFIRYDSWSEVAQALLDRHRSPR